MFVVKLVLLIANTVHSTTKLRYDKYRNKSICSN